MSEKIYKNGYAFTCRANETHPLWKDLYEALDAIYKNWGVKTPEEFYVSLSEVADV